MKKTSISLLGLLAVILAVSSAFTPKKMFASDYFIFTGTNVSGPSYSSNFPASYDNVGVYQTSIATTNDLNACAGDPNFVCAVKLDHAGSTLTSTDFPQAATPTDIFYKEQ